MPLQEYFQIEFTIAGHNSLLMTTCDFLLSTLSSLIASFIFIFLLLFLLRPQIEISTEICYQRSKFSDEKDKMCYVFKVINKSFFSAYDVTVDLNSLNAYPVTKGLNYRYTPLHMHTKKINFLPPFRFKWMKSGYGESACLFRTEENLHEILEGDQNSVQFQVTLRHGLSGLSKVFRMDYALKSCIKDGQFGFGKSFIIT